MRGGSGGKPLILTIRYKRAGIVHAIFPQLCHYLFKARYAWHLNFLIFPVYTGCIVYWLEDGIIWPKHTLSFTPVVFCERSGHRFKQFITRMDQAF